MQGPGDYLNQAEGDLNIAKENLKMKDYTWVQTRSQLCVINALKALIEYKGTHHRSNTIAGLLNEVQMVCDIPNEVYRAANAVDKKTSMPSDRISKFIILQAELVLGWVMSMLGY
ncbi:MAG: HEPN domain-containing protein [bacterium]